MRYNKYTDTLETIMITLGCIVFTLSIGFYIWLVWNIITGKILH